MPDRDPSLRLRSVSAGAWRKISGDTRHDVERVTAVIEVREPGYVPDAASRRAAISATLFTAEVDRGRLVDLERDPRVVSVELGRPLHRPD